jgi:hypothetical protein
MKCFGFSAGLQVQALKPLIPHSVLTPCRTWLWQSTRPAPIDFGNLIHETYRIMTLSFLWDVVPETWGRGGEAQAQRKRTMVNASGSLLTVLGRCATPPDNRGTVSEVYPYFYFFFPASPVTK